MLINIFFFSLLILCWQVGRQRGGRQRAVTREEMVRVDIRRYINSLFLSFQVSLRSGGMFWDDDLYGQERASTLVFT